MYDIRQFKPTLYFLILLGITGFSMAAESPGLWVLATAGVSINAWLVKTGRFSPMPRLVANFVTLLSLIVMIAEVRTAQTTPILMIGNFLVLLHLIKLYEQRANRDYAQLLVLSLLLMVAAAISTASLLFGLTFIAYLFISLYCCLLFHLKVETDQARAAFGQSEEKINPAVLRQDQRYLTRSMRRLTGLVSGVAICAAVVVFLFFPRGTGAGMLGPLQFRPSQTLTGFSDQVSFQQVAKITQNDDVVAHVKLYKGDAPVAGTQSLLMRGTTLDTYSGNDSNVGRWQWTRSVPSSRQPDSMHIISEGENATFSLPPNQQSLWRQEVSLQPTGTNVLFAMGSPLRFLCNREVKLRYISRDQLLQSADPLLQPLQYTIWSSASLWPTDPTPDSGSPRSNIDPKIIAYARRPEVSGTDSLGRSLAELRLGGDTSVDEQIARNIETHLRTTFTYTLDLTDAKRIGDVDPVVAFLYDLKRGHCEYFAGAMTLMCQGLGMPARMVVGFRCDDYNRYNGCYIVRQSHAHAWVEVRTAAGWLTFDPTSGRDSGAGRNASVWGDVKYMFDFLEFKWANSVVAYDRGNRQNLVEALDRRLVNTAGSGTQEFNWLSRTVERIVESSTLIGGLIGAMVIGLFGVVGWYFLEKWRIRRRAARIGLDTLPPSAQAKLARQLGFYDTLIRTLERHGVTRPRNLTPLEFSDSLTYLPGDVYDGIQRLTGLFYQIRYGDAELTPRRHHHLETVVGRISRAMQRAGAADASQFIVNHQSLAADQSQALARLGKSVAAAVIAAVLCIPAWGMIGLASWFIGSRLELGNLKLHEVILAGAGLTIGWAASKFGGAVGWSIRLVAAICAFLSAISIASVVSVSVAAAEQNGGLAAIKSAASEFFSNPWSAFQGPGWLAVCVGAAALAFMSAGNVRSSDSRTLESVNPT